MAYGTGAATDPTDLLDKLIAFVTSAVEFTTPWVLDYNVGNKASLHRDGVYIHLRANSTSITMYQSLGWIDAGTSLWLHTDDSGQGDASDVATSGRKAELDAAGPYTAYHFYAEEGTHPYVHVVVEVTAGQYRQALGFGNLIKSNDYVGGEYSYTHELFGGTQNNNPAYTLHQMGLDGVNAVTGAAAVMHIEGLPNVEAGHKWGLISDAVPTDDRSGTGRARLFGGTRGGLWVFLLGWMRSSFINTYKPLIPIPVTYRDEQTNPDENRWLGVQPGVAIINIAGYAPGDTISVGGQDWMVFPWWRKQKTGTVIDESWNAGIAYKKVV